jgi:hypothetical protein
LQKFKNKLTTYKANSLSHAARVELINSVFASIPVYYMSNIIFSKNYCQDHCYHSNFLVDRYFFGTLLKTFMPCCMEKYLRAKIGRRSWYSKSTGRKSWSHSLCSLENCGEAQ